MRLATKLLLVLILVLPASQTALSQNYSATLEGSQEAPPVVTGATGSATLVLDGDKVLSYEITFAGLESAETSAHVHGPALVGQNAGVVFVLPAGSPKIGNYGPLTIAEEADLNAGLWYINIHSSGYGAGEIRGQITASAVAVEPSTWGRLKRLFRN
jgi:hypothetical protein